MLNAECWADASSAPIYRRVRLAQKASRELPNTGPGGGRRTADGGYTLRYGGTR